MIEVDINTGAMGALKSYPDVRDYIWSSNVNPTELPESFELMVPTAKNQGMVSSCVAHAISSCLEYFDLCETNYYHKISTGFIYGNRADMNYKDEGMYINDALSSVYHYGSPYAIDWDENVEVPRAINHVEQLDDRYWTLAESHKITGYYRIKDVITLKTALFTGHPCIFSLTTRKGAYVDKHNIWRIDEKAKISGHHCMMIYGWDKNGWKVLNSWGRGWADKGTVILPYETKIDDIWGLEDNHIEDNINYINSIRLEIKKPFYHYQAIAKIINKILNFFWNIYYFIF